MDRESFELVRRGSHRVTESRAAVWVNTSSRARRLRSLSGVRRVVHFSAATLRILIVFVFVFAGATPLLANASGTFAAKPSQREFRLLFEGPACESPTWQPGRAQLACKGEGGLSVFGLDGKITASLPGNIRRFWWSENGARLLAEDLMERRIPVLFLLDPASSERARLMHPPRLVDAVIGFGASDRELWLEQIGGRIQERDTHLFRVPIEGGPVEPLDLRGSAFSRSGRGDLAFLRTAHRSGELFVSIYLKRKGHAEEMIGPDGFLPVTHGDLLSWSPDGRFLAVKGTTKDRDAWLFVFDLETPASKWKRLTLVASKSAGLAWAPDSQHLAVQTYRSKKRPKKRLSHDDLQLSVIDAETAEIDVLLPTESGCALWMPAWSANGLAVVRDCKGRPTGNRRPSRTLRIYVR